MRENDDAHKMLCVFVFALTLSSLSWSGSCQSSNDTASGSGGPVRDNADDGLQLWTQIIFDRFTILVSLSARWEADCRGMFGIEHNLTSMSDCVQKTKVNMVQCLCAIADIELDFFSFIESGLAGDDFIKPNRNCNSSSWLSGREPGWACTFHEESAPNLKNLKDLPDKTRDCRLVMKVFFCPHEISRDPQMKMKKHSGQQKREELQREVSVLENVLTQEETVRQVLQHVYDRKDTTPLSTTNSIPPKVKELLAELAMVEEEISRLESQIQDLQKDVKREQDATKYTKSKQLTTNQRNGGNVMISQQRHTPLHPLSSSLSSSLVALSSSNIKNNSNNGEKIGFDTKALHFINKAISGGYNLSPKTGFTDHHDHRHQQLPENHLQREAGLHERVVKRSGMLRPSASPLRDFRHPTPKPKERNVNVTEPPRKPISSSLSNGSDPTEESSQQKMQANRLSETILKCLMLIYVRLIRTWRQVELEKSGPISRSMHLSLSFRADHGGSGGEGGGSGGGGVGGGGGMKETKQQDPYGIFSNHNEPSIPRDIGPYKNLIVFTSSSLDAKCISSSNSIPLFQKLRGLLTSLHKVDVKSLSDQQKLAFWINMYNACIMHGYLQYGVPSTPKKLLALMNKATFNIGGNVVNAQAIEYCILRNLSLPNLTVNEAGIKDEGKAVIRELYGMESSNPNVIFALSCGTRSSPAVRLYTAEGVEAELERAKVEYLQASILVTSTKKIAFPELLAQNTHEFATDMDSLVEWVCNQLPTSGSLRKSMVDCFRTNNNTVVDKIPYDFEFQYLLPV